MILITGSIVARTDSFEALRALAIEHTRRSRAEPGCLSHQVSVDAEEPLRLVFVEQWADLDAVKKHFAVPASIGFVREARRLAGGPVTIELYDATELPNPVG